MNPKISVCIPVHNSQCWIAEALDSIEKQTFKDWEIVCVDDGSTDNSHRILDYFQGRLKDRMKIIRSTKNHGIAWARNKAKENARGEIICIQDSDDISQKDRLKNTLAFFKRHKSVDFVYGGFQYIDVFSKPLGNGESKPFLFDEWKKNNYICNPTVAYRRNIGVNYREECRVLDDLFFILDCYKSGKKFANLEDVLSFYRIHPSSVSRSEEKQKMVQEMRNKFSEEIKYL